MKIKDRIAKAMKDGPISYHELAVRVFPRDKYPRAWNYKLGGGPPGLVMTLSAALRRYGYTVECAVGLGRRVYPKLESRP